MNSLCVEDGIELKAEKLVITQSLKLGTSTVGVVSRQLVPKADQVVEHCPYSELRKLARSVAAPYSNPAWVYSTPWSQMLHGVKSVKHLFPCWSTGLTLACLYSRLHMQIRCISSLVLLSFPPGLELYNSINELSSKIVSAPFLPAVLSTTKTLLPSSSTS